MAKARIACTVSTMTGTDCLLIVFARVQRLGKVKTRLAPRFGDAGALAIYQQLLDRTFATARDFSGPVELWLDQPDAELDRRVTPWGWQCQQQKGADLGERMSQALAQGLARYASVLLVGSDCPVMDASYLRQAERALENHDVVFGASEDGGYVLVGGRRQQDWHPQRFAGVRFGGPNALQDSLSAFPEQQPAVLSALWDVDYPDDVERARAAGCLVSITDC